MVDDTQTLRQIARQRMLLRRVVGLLATVPIPQFAFALTGANVAALVLLPLRTMAGWPRHIKSLLWLSVLGVVLLAASALVQGVGLQNIVLVSTVSFALMLACAVKVTDGARTGTQFLIWTCVGTVAFFLLIPLENSPDTFAHLWKYGIAVPIALVAVAIVSESSTRRFWPIALLLGIGATSVFLGFRSHGLVCIAVVLLLFAKGASNTRRSAFLKILFAGVLFAAASVLLPAAIASGFFGETVRARTEEQLTSGASLLLSGRVEPPLSIAAVLARPWFGWGNLNAIDAATIAAGQQIAGQLGLQDPSAYMSLWVRSDGRVSVHSVLFEAWVQGGIFAALGPLFMIFLFAAAIVRVQGQLSPIVVLVSVQGIWDVLFSTWGAQRPGLLAVSIVVAAWAITERRGLDFGRMKRPRFSAAPMRVAALG